MLTIGEVEIASDSTGLVLRERNSFIRIEGEGIPEFIDFLRSCSISKINQRRVFRVPLFSDSGLSVKLLDGNEALSVVAHDISLHGIFVGCDAALKGEEGECVALELSFGEETLRIPATIRHRNESGVGMEFSDVTHPGLAHIVMELQRQWVAKRANVT